MVKKKQLTSDDIESACVYLIAKDGRVCVANVTDKLAIYSLIATQRFVELDTSKVVQLGINDLSK